MSSFRLIPTAAALLSISSRTSADILNDITSFSGLRAINFAIGAPPLYCLFYPFAVRYNIFIFRYLKMNTKKGEDMKKRAFLWGCIGVAAVALGCCDRFRSSQKEMDVVSSYCISSAGEEVQNINVVTHEPVQDFEGCAQEILERYMSNSFRTIDFDHDARGYPIEINADVYETVQGGKQGRRIFSVSYRQQSHRNCSLTSACVTPAPAVVSVVAHRNSTRFNYFLYKACEAVEIPKRGTHCIRKTYISRLYVNGVDEATIQKQAGHTDSSTTRSYYRFVVQNQQHQQEAISRAIGF